MFVVVWYTPDGEGRLLYSGGSKGLAEAKFGVIQSLYLDVEYQEWDDEGNLVHYKYRGAGHCED